jgi:hypothetical protein
MSQHGCPAIVLMLCGYGLMLWMQALKTWELLALTLDECTASAGLMYGNPAGRSAPKTYVLVMDALL